MWGKRQVENCYFEEKTRGSKERERAHMQLENFHFDVITVNLWDAGKRRGVWKIVQGFTGGGGGGRTQTCGSDAIFKQKPIDKRYAEGLIMLHHHGRGGSRKSCIETGLLCKQKFCEIC